MSHSERPCIAYRSGIYFLIGGVLFPLGLLTGNYLFIIMGVICLIIGILVYMLSGPKSLIPE